MDAWMRRLEGLKARSISRKSIPEFDGEGDAYWWLICIEKHFEATGTQKNEELMEAVKGLRNGALQWWQCWRRRHPQASWGKFTIALLWHYKPEYRDVLPIPDDEEEELEEESKQLTVQRSLDLRQEGTDQVNQDPVEIGKEKEEIEKINEGKRRDERQRKDGEDLKLGDDGSKFNISTTSAAAPEQGPHHRPTKTATPPKPPKPAYNIARANYQQIRRRTKIPWQELRDTEARIQGRGNRRRRTRKKKKKKPSPHSVSVACEKKTGSMVQFQRFGQVGDLMGHVAVLMGQAQFDEEKQGASTQKTLCNTMFTKLLGNARECHCNSFKRFGYFSYQQWDPGGEIGL